MVIRIALESPQIRRDIPFSPPFSPFLFYVFSTEIRSRERVFSILLEAQIRAQIVSQSTVLCSVHR